MCSILYYTWLFWMLYLLSFWPMRRSGPMSSTAPDVSALPADRSSRCCWSPSLCSRRTAVRWCGGGGVGLCHVLYEAAEAMKLNEEPLRAACTLTIWKWEGLIFWLFCWSTGLFHLVKTRKQKKKKKRKINKFLASYLILLQVITVNILESFKLRT